jgi:hypothetical protein
VPAYEILLSLSVFFDEPLWIGEALHHAGDVWRVDEVLRTLGDEQMRLVLRPWPEGEPLPETVRDALG